MIQMIMNNHPIAAVVVAAAVAAVIQVILPTTPQQKKVTMRMQKRVNIGMTYLLQFLTNQSMVDALDVNITHSSNPKLLLINGSRSISGIVIHSEGTFMRKFHVSYWICLLYRESHDFCSTEQSGDTPQFTCT
jgi:hypothetical protein